jgi:hypothetical protein
MWVEIVRVVGWSRCPTTRRSMLCIKTAIIIKRKIHASLSLFSMQISHIKYQPFFFFFERKQTKQRKEKRKEKIFSFVRNRNNKNKLQIKILIITSRKIKSI